MCVIPFQMTLKEDLMNCLAEQLSLYPKIQHLEINSDLSAHHMLPNVDLSRCKQFTKT